MGIHFDRYSFKETKLVGSVIGRPHTVRIIFPNIALAHRIYITIGLFPFGITRLS